MRSMENKGLIDRSLAGLATSEMVCRLVKNGSESINCKGQSAERSYELVFERLIKLVGNSR